MLLIAREQRQGFVQLQNMWRLNVRRVARWSEERSSAQVVTTQILTGGRCGSARSTIRPHGAGEGVAGIRCAAPREDCWAGRSRAGGRRPLPSVSGWPAIAGSSCG